MAPLKINYAEVKRQAFQNLKVPRALREGLKMNSSKTHFPIIFHVYKSLKARTGGLPPSHINSGISKGFDII